LSDRERRFRQNGSHSWLDRDEAVRVFAAEIVERRPLLPIETNVLPFVFAD
jgi:hypothetical protein